ncbi:MAG: 6-phosphogluconolactonase [Thiobacillus sp.]
MLPEFRTFADADTLVTQLADALCEAAEAAIATRGVFHLVLAGGSTPAALYRTLAHRHAGDERWHVWYGDERCLAMDHPERNSVVIETAWLSASHIPPENRRPMQAERGPHDAAALYAGWLSGAADFDVVLLGMGEDGHTASLFPRHGWGEQPDSADVLAVYGAPKPPPERVSLSVARLNRSRRVWFVITGAGKREALQRWKEGEALPIAAVHGKQQTVAWVDTAAMPTDQ